MEQMSTTAADELPAYISDDTADAILWTLQDHANRTFTPSEMARKTKTDTSTALTVLQYLASAKMARTSGNGAWTRYYAW